MGLRDSNKAWRREVVFSLLNRRWKAVKHNPSDKAVDEAKFVFVLDYIWLRSLVLELNAISNSTGFCVNQTN